MYVLCTLVVLSLHSLLKSWSRPGPNPCEAVGPERRHQEQQEEEDVTKSVRGMKSCQHDGRRGGSCQVSSSRSRAQVRDEQVMVPGSAAQSEI